MTPSTFASEVRLVEFTARYLWGALGPVLGANLAQRCRQCVLPETYTELGTDGLCSQCRDYQPPPASAQEDADNQGYERWREVLAPLEKAGSGQYDALLLFSGGKDSCFLLHYITTMCPELRLLVVLIDNGFMSPIAMQNAKHILTHFDVDRITVQPRPGFVRKVFHHALTHLEQQRGYSIVDLLDGYITFDTAKNLAARMDIPAILCGLSKAQAENAFGLPGHEFPIDGERQALTEHAGIELRQVFDEDEMLYWWDGSLWPAERVPRFILPLCLWDPGEAYILRKVVELGLISKKHSSPLLTNNALIPVIGMAEVARFGYSSFEVEFARSIREGKSDRRYWLHLFQMLEYSAKTGRFVNRTAVQTLASLGLTKADIGLRS